MTQLQPVPHELRTLLSAGDAASSEQAWTAFLELHSKLLLHVARSLRGDHDAVMDRYAFMLDGLRRDDHRRLRSYAADSRSSFATWLVVVARRMVLDHHRQRHGRSQSESDSATERLRQRRRLHDLVGNALELEKVEASPGTAPDLMLEQSDRSAAIQQALAELEPEDRLLLRLRFEEELSVPALARMLGESSPFRVYRRLDRILSRLRRSLEAAGIENGHGPEM